MSLGEITGILALFISGLAFYRSDRASKPNLIVGVLDETID